MGVTGLDKILKVADLVGTPKHGGKFQAEGVRISGFIRTPRVDGRNLGGDEVLEGWVIAQGPTKTDLSTTSLAGASSIRGRGRCRGRGRFGGGWGGLLAGGMRGGNRFRRRKS